MTHRTDRNQKDIMNAFRQLGYSLIDLSRNGKGCPDLLVSKNRYTFLVEIKNPAGRNRIEKSQNTFRLTWQGDIYIIHSIEEVIKLDRKLKLCVK